MSSAPAPAATDRPAGIYGSPRLDCDLVMKGGITSGVVYPLAICKLAESYRLHSIGGASAGAIAAAAAAAAEYARRAGRLDGYKKLEGLPDELARPVGHGRTRLMSLFQPVPATRTIFDILLASIAKTSRSRKVERVAALVLYRHWPLPLLGGALAVALFSFGTGGALQAVALAISALVVILAGLLGGSVAAVRAAYRGVANNYGGICRGHTAEPPQGAPALCEWLADLIDDIAEKPEAAPLTFGDLRDPDPSRDIELAMMTTNLSHGRPYRLPFPPEVTFWFDRREIGDLFPPRIAGYLERAGRAHLESGPEELRRIFADNGGDAGPYLPLPPGDQLPVVFGARLSLSFPVLLSAVPLYAVDWTTVRHPRLERLDALGTLAEETRPHEDKIPAPGKLVLRRCWFSDGGICSNLPIHFFDALLPKKPTFALSLRTARKDASFWQPGRPGSESDNVQIPDSLNAEFAETWQEVGSPGGLLGAVQLLAAMVETMQNWNDNTLAKAPGYRDRVVQISHLTDEGGMNLDMSAELIARLSLRGEAAGQVIAARFDREAGDGWKRHLWVRYRSALAMLQSLLSTAHKRYFADPEGKDELGSLVDDPPCYPLSQQQKSAAAAANTEFEGFRGFDSTIDFIERAPRPISDLRPRPRGE